MLTANLRDNFEIHVLEIDHDNKGMSFENGIFIHRIKYSFIGKFLNPRISKSEPMPQIRKQNKKKLIKLGSKLKKAIRNIFFPDTVVFEKRHLVEKTNFLINTFDFEIVIASGFPFTTLFLSKSIKTSFPSVRFIYDIGDPFFLNSQNGPIRNYFARKFENSYLRYIDTLVVNNSAIYKHYLTYFGEVVKSAQIRIIPMGAPISYIDSHNKSRIERNNYGGKINQIKVVYAGQFYRSLREPFELYKAINKINELDNETFVTLDIYGTFSGLFKPARGLDFCIFFKGYTSNDKIIEAYFNSDIIVFIDNAFGIQTPGKIFEIAVIGKPVLFISDHMQSSAYEAVKKFSHIFLCRNKEKDIAETISSIENKVDQDLINQVRNEFSWERRAKEYFDLIND